jgi:hypothetical protein
MESMGPRELVLLAAFWMLRRNLLLPISMPKQSSIASTMAIQPVQLRRQMLLFARSLPRGSPERNGRRQIAASLRSLFRNKRWLDARTVEGSQ